MKTIKVRCKCCNREIESKTVKTISCGCSNLTTIRGDKISAVDLTKVVMLNSYIEKETSGVLTREDIAWQESRRNRKVRKLDFEIR